MKPSYRKILKVLTICVVVLLAFLKFIAEPYVENRLSKWQPQQKHLYYKLDLGKVDANLLAAKIKIVGLNLSLDPDFMTKGDSLKVLHLFEIETDLTIQLINAFRLILFDELKVSDVRFENSHITWYPNFRKVKRQKKKRDSVKIKSKLNTLNLGEVVIDKAKLRIKDKAGLDGKEIMTLQSVDINIYDFLLQLNARDTTLLPEFSELNIITGAFDFEYEGGVYNYGDFKLNTTYREEDDQYILDASINDLGAELKNNQGNITASAFIIKNLNFDDLLLHKKITADTLIISNSDIQLVKPENKPVQEKDTLSPSSIDTLNIKVLELEGGKFTLQDQNQKTILGIDSLELILSDIHSLISSPDETTFKGTLMKSGPIESRLNNYYNFSLQGFDFITETKMLNLRGFKLSPIYSRPDFSKEITYEQDLFDVKCDSLQILFNNSFKVFEREFYLEKLDVYQLNLNVFRDKWVEDPPYKEKELPAMLITQIETPFFIKNIHLHRSNVSYSQLGDIVENSDPGKFELVNLRGQINNITNIDSLLNLNSKMVASINARIMNAGDMKANFEFDMRDPDLFFKSNGQINELPLVRLNPFLMGVLLVEIPNGQIQDLTYEMEANRDYIFGTLEMEYQDLEVDIHKTNKPNKSSGFISFLANAAVRKNNLKEDKGYKQGVVFTETVKNKSLFNNFWQGIKSGLLDIIVITSNNKKSLEKFEKHNGEVL